MSYVEGSRYGGNTSCMTVESEGRSIIIDAGSGIMLLEKELLASNQSWPAYNVLLSHLHMDHTVGFGTFAQIWNKDNKMKIFTCTRTEKPLKEQVFEVFNPPNWPASLVKAPGVSCVPVEGGVPFTIDHFTITPLIANHPDKTLSFHINDGKKVFVHLLDSETSDMDTKRYDELIQLCRGADLVAFDSSYSSEDYHKFRGWGHSTVEQGVKLARDCKPKRMLFSHFAQQYSDDQIDSWTRYYDKEPCSEFIMARDGLEILSDWRYYCK